MITRTFRAETMMQALEQVKRDLGPEALVVTARQIPAGQPWQVWRKPMVEIVAVRLEAGEDSSSAVSGTPKENAPVSTTKPATKDLTRKDTPLPKQIKPAPVPQSVKPVTPAPQPAQSTTSAPEAQIKTEENLPADPVEAKPVEAVLPRDVVEIQGKKTSEKSAAAAKIDLLHNLGKEETLDDVRIVQIPEKPKQGLPPLQLPQIPWQPPVEQPSNLDGAWPLLQKMYDQLTRQGVETRMVRKICQLSADTLGYETAMDDRKLVDYLRRQLEAYIRVLRETPRKERQVICLVGPSGAGKTSLTAKLAVRYRNELKRSVVWVCADTVRTGGIAEARAFSEAIDVPLHIAYTPGECAAIIETTRDADLVIVDTPACNPRSEESLIETGALLTSIPDRLTWVVLPATAKENDLMNAAGAFSVFNPRALVVTKMDETNSFGSVYNLGLRSQLPFAYFSYGSRVMDDLVPAAASRLVQALFTERFDR